MYLQQHRLSMVYNTIILLNNVKLRKNLVPNGFAPRPMNEMIRPMSLAPRVVAVAMEGGLIFISITANVYNH